MRKITFLFVTMFCFAFTWQSRAQFTESFETEIPASWTVINGGSANTWVRLNNPTGGAQQGTAVASITYNATAHDDYLITPAITVAAGVNDRISYYVKSRSASFLEPYAVRLSTTTPDAIGLTTVLQATSEAPAAWTQITFDLTPYLGQTVYIAIHATGTDEWQLFVDNVVNDTPPSCPAPTALTASNFTLTTADLGWTESGSSANWDIEWGADGFAPTGTPNVNDTSDNPYTLTGLSEGTDYDFYVRSDCGADDTSDPSIWVGPYSFTTAFTAPDCATTPFPADGATNVPAGEITFTWTAPASGPTPTAYNIYAYDDAIGTNPALITTVTTTSADLVLNAFDTAIFWSAVPVNGNAEASGCAIWSFTTQSYPGFCLVTAYASPYPSATYTPTTCDGTTPNNITTFAYASEYSNVQVTAGQTYEFRSSLPDLITISYDGTTAEAYGVTPLTWTATTDGVIRFYTHLDDNNCGAAAVSRTRSVLCGPSLGVNSFDAAALKVYPNPVKNILNLSYTTEISSVAVYNMLGQVVLSKTVNANQEALNMSALNSGAYFVKVTINDATETIRVIKQ